MSKRDAKDAQEFIKDKNLTIYSGKTRSQKEEEPGKPSTSREAEEKSEYESITDSIVEDRTVEEILDPLEASAFNSSKLTGRSPIQERIKEKTERTPPSSPPKPPSTSPPKLNTTAQGLQIEIKPEESRRKKAMDSSSEGYSEAVEKYAKADTTDAARIKIVTELSDNAYEQFLNDVIAHRECNQELRLKIIKKIMSLTRANEGITEIPNRSRGRIAEFTTKNLNKFHGDENENFNEWLIKITIAIGTHGFDDNEALLAVASQVAGTAFNWYETYIARTNNPKWSEFKKILRDNYINPNQELAMRKKLSELNVRNFPSLSKYNDEFMKVVTQIDSMAEPDKIHNYLRGLDSETVIHIQLQKPTLLSEAVNLARTYHSIKNHNQIAKVNYAAKTFNSPKKNFAPRQENPPSYGQVHNHQNSQRYSNKTQTQQPKKEFKIKQCYICGKTNHLQKECFKNPNRITKKVNNIDVSAPVNNDHFNQSFGLTDNQDKSIKKHVGSIGVGSELSGTTVKVNSKEIAAYFDTGAEVSIMDYETVVVNEFQILPTKIIIKTANNQEVIPIGETENLAVELGNSICYLKFIIIHHDNHPILLGRDWFNITGASINPSRNTVTFPGTELWLTNTNIHHIDNLNVMSEPDEGRLDYVMQQQSFEEDFGIDVYEIKEIGQIIPVETIPEHLEKEWLEAAEAIKERCSTGSHDIGRYIGEEMTIKLIDPNDYPAVTPNYPRSHAENEEIEEHCQKLAENGIIEESTSPWNNPILLMKKKSSKEGEKPKTRVVHDLRATNLKIENIIFPIMAITTIFESLADATWFSVCDMSSGFWQLPLAASSRLYTAFSSPRNHLQYKVLCQGIKSGPAWFNLCVGKAMRECRGYSLNYFDNIVIYSKTLKDHISHIKAVMLTLKKFGFKITHNKSIWVAKEIKLLGYIVSGKTVRINPEKIATIRDRPAPKTVKQVQQALGLFNFYRRFINNFAEKSKLLYDLLRKDVKFIWTKEHNEAYRYFVDCVTSAPAMAQPRLDQPFIVYSDGSKYAIGGVLAQIIDGVEHIIEYASRLLRGAELNYGISEIECLAVVFLIRKWHTVRSSFHFVYRS